MTETGQLASHGPRRPERTVFPCPTGFVPSCRAGSSRPKEQLWLLLRPALQRGWGWGRGGAEHCPLPTPVPPLLYRADPGPGSPRTSGDQLPGFPDAMCSVSWGGGTCDL